MNRTPPPGRRLAPFAPAISSKKSCSSHHHSPRSPLKDLNLNDGENGVCSSTASCETSIEAPRGCLRFLMPNSSKTTTPGIRTKPSSQNPRNSPIHHPKLKSITVPNERRKVGEGVSRLCRWQSGKKSSSASAKKLKREEIVVAGFGGSTNLDGSEFHFTPVGRKLGSESDLGCGYVEKLDSDGDRNGDGNGNTPVSRNGNTPPVEASVSPEIQCGPPVVSVKTNTPVCYGAGPAVSGVTDRRKCRPRGVLIVGEKSSGIDKVKILDDDGVEEDEDILDSTGNYSRCSFLVPPLPAEASMHWLLSPCDEETEKGDDSEVRASLHMQSPSSGSSGYGISSHTDTIRTVSGEADHKTAIIREKSLISPSGRLVFRSILGSPCDIMASCSSSSPSTAPYGEVIALREDKGHSNLIGLTSPLSRDTPGSENLMLTPVSNSSSEEIVPLPCIRTENQKRTSLFCEEKILALEQIRSSFELESLLKPSTSIDFTQLHWKWDNYSWFSDSSAEKTSQSQLRISWRDGLACRIFEMDELDCCKCLSDAEEGIGSKDDEIVAKHASPEIKHSEIGPEPSVKFVHDNAASCLKKRRGNSPLNKSIQCAESISMDGGSLAASGDSEWDMCYKNNLYGV